MTGLAIGPRLGLRDLRGGTRAFRVFVACLALGVAAIAAIGSLGAAVRGGIAANARSLLGGDIDIRLVHRQATPAQARALAAAGTVSEIAQLRAMARTQDGARRRLVELKAVDGAYPLVGAVALSAAMPLDQALAKENGVWGAVVERGLLAALAVGPGDTLAIGDARYVIRAVIEREPDRGVQVFFGPRVMVALASLPETGLIQPGSLVTRQYRLALADPGDADRVVHGLTAAFPDAGWRLRRLDQAAPGLDRFVTRTELYLTLVALSALLVGGLGMAHAAAAWIETRTATIATLKCLGADRALIFQACLTQMGLFALIAIAAGVVLGAALPFLAAAPLGARLGVTVVPGPHPMPILLAAAFGLATALLFTLLPLGRAAAIAPATLFRDLVAPAAARPSRRVILAASATALLLAGLMVASASDRRVALGFVAGAAVAVLIFRLAALALAVLAQKAPKVAYPALRLALANLHRPGTATVSMVLSLGLGITVLTAVLEVEASLAREIERTLPAAAPTFYFIDIQGDQRAAFRSLAAGWPGVGDYQEVPMLRGRITRLNGVPVETIRVPPDLAWVVEGDRGITWAAAPPPGTRVLAGSWWPADYAGDLLVSLDAEVARGFGLRLGDTLAVNVLGRTFLARIANLREVDWSRLGINFVMVFSPGALNQAPQTAMAALRVPPDQEDALERAVTDRFANVSAIRVKEALDSVDHILSGVVRAVQAVAGVTLLAGLLVLAGTAAALRGRRIADAVVMKVLGATRGDLLRALLIEHGLIGLAAAGVAVPLGAAASWAVVARAMDLPWTFSPLAGAGTAAASIGIATIFGIFGSLRAVRAKAAPYLRNP
jgi:putative ABC transport system permease protein